MSVHLTSTTPLVLPPCAGIEIQNNAALTGTITVADSTGTIAIVTNPGIQQLKYYGFSGAPTVTLSATGDCTINVLSRTIG